MAKYGYARVSTKDQNVNRQLDALTAFPVERANIFVDYFTGVSFERPRYQELLGCMRAGDVLVVKSIDRLGRNYAEILRQWQMLTKERAVDIVVLDMPLLDTRHANGDLTGTFIADVVLQLLSYIAQVERENIRQRQAEGIAAAQARGIRFGRPRKERPAAYAQVRAHVERGELTHRAAAAELGVCRATFEKWLKADRAAERGLRERGLDACGERGNRVRQDGPDADERGKRVGQRECTAGECEKSTERAKRNERGADEREM